ncbi:Eya3 protein [Roseibium sp. TrichSKD4]|nr:Eya3 protein [Roseibium sp. TrichSKD4]
MGPQRLEALSRLRSDISSFEATLRQKLQLGAPGGEFAKLKQIYSASQASGKIIEAIRAM